MVARSVLIVKKTFADLLVDGKKTGEVRSRRTMKRGLVYVSASGKGGAETVIGLVHIVDCEGPVSVERYKELAGVHLVTPGSGFGPPDGGLPYKRTYVWHVSGAQRLDHPLPCPRKHCVTWATFEE